MTFDEALKAWATQRLINGMAEFVRVERCSVSASAVTGCPTCGPEVEHEVHIFYWDGKKYRSTWCTVDFDTFLKELFEVSA